MEEQLNMLLLSYDLTDILEENDIEEIYVLELLVDKGLVRLEDYFEVVDEH